MSAPARLGRQVFQAHCAVCHAIRGSDAAGILGPDLSHLMSRRTLAAGFLANTPGNLAGWIADPQALDCAFQMMILWSFANHGAGCLSGGGTSGSPSNAVWANEGTGRGIALYATSAGTPQALNAAAIKPNGGNQPHNNMPPFLGLYFIIAMQGLFPTRG